MSLYTPGLTHPRTSSGSIIIRDTDNHTELNGALMIVLEDAVISSMTAPNKRDSGDLIGRTLTAGLQTPGPISQIQLSSGMVEILTGY